MGRRLAYSLAAVLIAGGFSLAAGTPALAAEVCSPTGSEVLSFGQVFQDDPNTDIGTSYVISPGVNGAQEILDCYDDEVTDPPHYQKNGARTEPIAEIVAVGTRTPAPANPGTGGTTPTAPRPKPAQTPAPAEPAAPVVTPTPTPTPVELGDIEYDPTYYDVQPGSGQNLLATGALVGAILVTCLVVVAAILYRRFFRDRLKYRGR